jgi:hypothetical protein
MTTPSNSKPKKDSGFGSFAFGVAVGVGAALLLGTEEGRQFTSKLLDTIKENLPPSPSSHPAMESHSNKTSSLSQNHPPPTYTPGHPLLVLIPPKPTFWRYITFQPFYFDSVLLIFMSLLFSFLAEYPQVSKLWRTVAMYLLVSAGVISVLGMFIALFQIIG